MIFILMPNHFFSFLDISDSTFQMKTCLTLKFCGVVVAVPDVIDFQIVDRFPKGEALDVLFYLWLVRVVQLVVGIPQ